MKNLLQHFTVILVNVKNHHAYYVPHQAHDLVPSGCMSVYSGCKMIDHDEEQSSHFEVPVPVAAEDASQSDCLAVFHGQYMFW